MMKVLDICLCIVRLSNLAVLWKFLWHQYSQCLFQSYGHQVMDKKRQKQNAGSLISCLPSILCCKFWKDRCHARYGYIKMYKYMSIVQVTKMVTVILKTQFAHSNCISNWKELCAKFEISNSILNIKVISWNKPKQSPRPSHSDPLSEEAPLLPKLLGYIAEFLRESCFTPLYILNLPTYITKFITPD